MTTSTKNVFDYALEHNIDMRKAALSQVIVKIATAYKDAGITF